MFYESNVSRIPMLEKGFSLSYDVLSVSEIKLPVKNFEEFARREFIGEIFDEPEAGGQESEADRSI